MCSAIKHHMQSAANGPCKGSLPSTMLMPLLLLLLLQVTFGGLKVRNYLLTTSHGSLAADNNDCDAWW